MRLASVLATVMIGVVSVAAPVTAQAVPSVEAAPSSAVDPQTLEALCVRNATDPSDLAMCLDVVRRFLGPSASPDPSSAPALNDKVTVSGGGDKSTKAFQLSGGDYTATLVSRDLDPKGYGWGCSTRGGLKLTDDRSGVGTVSGAGQARKSGATVTQIYGVEPGRYYWDFGMTTCEKWTVTLEGVSFSYGNEPEPGVVVRRGRDTLDTTPFALADGDHTVEVSLKASGGDCNLNAYLIPVAEHTLFSNAGDVSAQAAKRRTTTDETQLYAISADHYYWSVSALTFGGTCDWTLTVRRQ